MTAINLNKAQHDYPSAWYNIRDQMAQLKQASDADIVPITAAIIEVKGVLTLEVICMTDLVFADSDDESSAMRFQAAIREPPVLTLVS